MDWQGIEWAVPVFELAMIVLPIYAFVKLYRSTKRGARSKSRALLRYAFLAGTPTVLCVVSFFVIVGIEDLTVISIISEGLARTFPLLAGLGCMVWIVSTLIFGAAIAFIKDRPLSPPSDSRAERAP